MEETRKTLGEEEKKYKDRKGNRRLKNPFSRSLELERVETRNQLQAFPQLSG